MLDCLEGSCREKEGRRVERLGLISCGTMFIDWESADGPNAYKEDGTFMRQK